MSPYVAELVGTTLLILLGNGVVAGAVLKESKAANAGWLAITVGWGLAVMIAVYCVGTISGAHLNPAVTLGLAATGRFPWGQVPGYLLAQLAGAFLGAVLVWLVYRPHWRVTNDAATSRNAFCTSPAIDDRFSNLMCEIVATAVLVFGILAIPSGANFPVEGWSTGLGPLLVGLLIVAIGLSLGGPTGYAINPARDLGPRIAYAVLPFRGDAGWGYAWVPIVGPVVGGVAGASLYSSLYPAPI